MNGAEEYLSGTVPGEERIEKELIKIFSKIVTDKWTDSVFIFTGDLKLIYFNQAAARLFNIKKNLLGKSIKSLNNFLDAQSMEKIIKTINEKREWTGEISIPKDNGQIIYFESNWCQISENPAVGNYFLIINREITELKKLEKQILHSQRMESIGFLAGGIVHEINNLFTPILMSVKYIRKHLSDETSRKMLGTIKSSVERGSELIKQVLIFSRSEERETEFIDFNDIIRELKSIILQTFSKNIKIVIDAQDDLWKIKGNFTQFYQVILNLCLNASDAMPEGGKLELSVKNITLDNRFAKMADIASGRYLQIIVSDTGIGIPEQSIPKIFDPFFTSKDVGKGTGLGLPTSLTIVKKHGGVIKVYSILGKGTSFKIYLPVSEQEFTACASIDEIKNISRGDGETILVVDDEIKILTTIEEVLKSNGYKVLRSETGQEALKIFQKKIKSVSLVLTDIQMPQLDGYGLYDKIKELKNEIPVILSSGLISEGELKVNPDGSELLFLMKPYTEEKLLKTIAFALGKNN